MHLLDAPYRVLRQFARSNRSKPDALPVAWAVRTDTVKSARILGDCLRLGEASRVELVLGPRQRVYVRWED